MDSNDSAVSLTLMSQNDIPKYFPFLIKLGTGGGGPLYWERAKTGDRGG